MSPTDKSQVILAAALQVFRTKSFHGATTKEIADAAGVPVGTMFRLFPNKEDLLLGLVAELEHNVAPRFFAESLDQALDSYFGTGMEEAIKAFIHGRLMEFHQNKDLISVIHAESAYNPVLKQAMYERMYNPMRSIIEKFITKGIERGRFRAIDPVAASRYIGSCVLFTFLDVWYQNLELTGPTLETIETQFVDLILHGINGGPS